MDPGEAPALSLSEHFCRKKFNCCTVEWGLTGLFTRTASSCLWNWGLGQTLDKHDAQTVSMGQN